MRNKQTNLSSAKINAGFTLIELLVVISIIGLLASVILVSLNNSRLRARDAKRIGDMNQFSKAMELYFNSNFSYPTMTTSGSLTSFNPSVPVVPGYLAKLPTAPSPADGGCGAGPGNGSNDYYFYANSIGPSQSVTNTYLVTFCLGKTTGSLSPGPHTLTQAGFQ